ncbi:hypothetical protein F4804DRAFT_19057 [Jackrogersella minutella]|nr:hypothetical protein F4804DRAFT_19057 [Jackrogersella minutella]
MRFLVSLATFAAAAAAYDTTPFLGPLQPWTVSSLQITAPQKGGQGAVDIEVAVANPNTVSAGPAPHAAGGGYLPFSPSAANCSLAGTSEDCEETSDTSYGVWSVGVVGDGVDPTDLDLKFRLDYNVTRWNAVWYKVYEGTGHFATGVNLVQGGCDGAAGTCEYEIAAPVLVQPTMTECKGTCTMPSAS